MTISSLGTAARDYATVALWIADCPGDLVTATDTWEGEMYADSEFVTGATTAITGITANATFNIQLRCATGESFKDAGPTVLDYNTANGVAMRCTAADNITLSVEVNNTEINGLQLRNSAGGYARTALYLAGTDATATQMLCKGGGSSQARAAVRLADAQTFANSLVIADLNSAHGMGVNTFGNGAGLVVGVTVVQPNSFTGGVGITAQYSGTAVKGCAIFGFDDATSGSFDASSGYNGTDDSAAPGSNNVTGLTFADQFEDIDNATADFRLATGSDLEAAAIQFAETSDVDIIGQARSVTTPDIGSWEFQSASGGDTAELTGVSSTTAVGTLTASGKANKVVTGVSSATAVGTLTASSGTASTNLTGASSTCAAGTVIATGQARITINGVSASGTAGVISPPASASVSPTGVAASCVVGTLIPVLRRSISGVSSTCAVGTVSATGKAGTTPTGVSANGIAGHISVAGFNFGSSDYLAAIHKRLYD